MDVHEAIELIGAAIPRGVATWADLGAGEGTFTRALAELLDRGSRLYAVDRDARALAVLERWAVKTTPEVIPVRADFTKPFELPGLEGAALDGVLLANALHFAPDGDEVLARLARWLAPQGRLVIVEYDRRPASRWVPYPVPFERFEALAARAGLSTPRHVASRPSAYGGQLYSATAVRASSPERPPRSE
jgi:ubiquinone/menaquinone biosynthesis C-methylase UbiE